MSISETSARDEAGNLRPNVEISQYGEHTLFMERTYVGAVLGERERNMRDDSDFFAIVWDEATQSIREFTFASTRGWSYANGCSVDATDEVKAKARAVIIEQKFAQYMSDNRTQAKKIHRGNDVRFLKSTKFKKEGITVPEGATGDVFWLGQDSRRSTVFSAAYRVGVRLVDGTRVFIADDKLEVVDWENRLESETEIRRQAVFYAERNSMASLPSAPRQASC